jgi:hypothetical protein
VTKPKNLPDFDETRAGFRSGEGSESVMRQLMSAARRKQSRKAGFPDSQEPTRPSGDTEPPIDVQLP